jgi:lipopolysaccharide transport system ATP-binding protein
VSDVVIRVENLSKRYKLGATIEHNTLRDQLAAGARSLFRRSKQAKKQEQKDFWALKDINFEIKQGEVLGIIGRNGAGKSTLLKILSRITAPTTGYAEINGRVGSLLEVGTGFHSELTGRENVYMNAAILGMTREEINRKFDEIVAFAEVEQFIDTPVKRYSSGMLVRLAFSVAAHIEPEVLIIDEVLAVGDATFQKKCLGKMGDVAGEGRTVLFVSHNMDAVTRLCNRAILINQGQLIEDNLSHIVVKKYLQSDLGARSFREWTDWVTSPGNDIALLRAVRVKQDGKLSEAIDIRKAVAIEIEYLVQEDGHSLSPNIHVHNDDGVIIFITNDLNPKYRSKPRPKGLYRSTVWIPGNFLSEGNIIVDVALSTYIPLHIHFWEKDVVSFTVLDSLEGDSVRGDYAGPYPGVVRPLLNWETEQIHS